MNSKPTSSTGDGMTTNPQTGDTDHGFFPNPAPLDCGDLAETFRIDVAAALYDFAMKRVHKWH